MSATESSIDVSKLTQENKHLREQLADLQTQLDWLKRQLFGRKSEKQLRVDPALQADLLSALGVAAPPLDSPPTETITYERRKKQRDATSVNDTGLRFDDSVPVKVIEIANPELANVPADQQVEISEKITYRLAQRPASYVVLKYVRKVIKHRDTQTLHTAATPFNVLDKSIADVSFLAGMLVDKFVYHLPLYRQHQRLQQSGIRLSRATLTNLVSRAIDLLAPIVDAQYANILLSRILALDETPIKAGRKEKGKMRLAYFWPLYGELDEIVFHYTSNRAHQHVTSIIGNAFDGTLLTDGYAAYARYAEQCDKVTHAQCWSHARRAFEKAEAVEPHAVQEALAIIGALYRHEGLLRDKALVG